MALPQSQRDRIANLLAHDVQHSVIAGACGISPGRLSQLIEQDEELKALVAQEQSKQISKVLAREQEYEKIEQVILGELPSLAESCTSLGEGVRALAMLHDLRTKRTAQQAQEQSGGIGAGVQLQLSDIANARISVILNNSKTIIEIGGQNVQPMQRGTLEDYLNAEPEAIQVAERNLYDDIVL